MKIETRYLWDCRRHRPNVYFNVKPETTTEQALIGSLYSLRPKVIMQTDGEFMIDFFPEGEKK